MSKHTKGPWEVLPIGHTFDIVTAKKDSDGDGKYICGDADRGDAQLIAAAPEMYDFLKDLLKSKKLDTKQSYAYMERLATLIAKAEGR